METYKKEEKPPVTVTTAHFAKGLHLKTLYAASGAMTLSSVSTSRPGLMLTGFSDHFAASRVQVLGKAEMNYLDGLTGEQRYNALKSLFVTEIPCVIVSRGQRVDETLIKLARECAKPLFLSEKITTELITELSNYLNEVLADTLSIHGVLVDVYGTGVLLVGKSGIGKSETALELVHRGHRLVADDIVDLKRVKDNIYGESPELIKHFMEIRGVGIIDVKAIFGVGAVLDRKKVELIIELETWDDSKHYERLGLTRHTEKLLGIAVSKIVIPVIPGRNLAIVIEVSARDYRLKQSGYNPAAELSRRMKDTN